MYMHARRMVDLGGQLLTLIIGLRLSAASAGKRVIVFEGERRAADDGG
jgi:hypothetical protein